jgi:octaheme c-type cytochrome (tetrathionate reductase family)
MIIAVPLLLFVPPQTTARDNPWDSVPSHPIHTDHTSLMTGPFASGQEVTRTCLTCHEDAAHEVMQTAHWTWLGDPVQIEGQDELIAIGKANLLNNFCIGVQSNWPGCTRCHAGYGWENASFDFSSQENVDCLVCHDQSGGYVKATAGLPAEDVNLVAAAQSVGIPTRENCGYCHFNGGGGNGVKHGDLDESLYYPTEDIDVHMGSLNFQCVDCHQTENHEISGRSMSVSVDSINQTYCTDCHNQMPHEDNRINAHVDTVACQTCHIPNGALRDPTKMEWDWSTAGQNLPEDLHTYLRIKGSFIYESNFVPEYAWYNGMNDRYLLGDTIDPELVTVMNMPYGSIDDPGALIWPFKIHRGSQIYDAIYNYFQQPQTAGEGGYWTTFDWDSALRNGSAATGLPYSGSYGFAPTEMYWPLSHMVVPADQALQCTACHGENSRMDWEALGYYGDPMIWGGRGA